MAGQWGELWVGQAQKYYHDCIAGEGAGGCARRKRSECLRLSLSVSPGLKRAQRSYSRRKAAGGAVAGQKKRGRGSRRRARTGTGTTEQQRRRRVTTMPRGRYSYGDSPEMMLVLIRKGLGGTGYRCGRDGADWVGGVDLAQGHESQHGRPGSGRKPVEPGQRRGQAFSALAAQQIRGGTPGPHSRGEARGHPPIPPGSQQQQQYHTRTHLMRPAKVQTCRSTANGHRGVRPPFDFHGPAGGQGAIP
jgi:hypothetical protein